jgi:hypothetical protein
MGDGFEIWVKNGSFSIKGLSMTIAAIASWIESLGEFVLGCPISQQQRLEKLRNDVYLWGRHQLDS